LVSSNLGLWNWRYLQISATGFEAKTKISKFENGREVLGRAGFEKWAGPVENSRWRKKEKEK
jgi:hypothetical protein